MDDLLRVLFYSLSATACMLGVLFTIMGKSKSSKKTKIMFVCAIALTVFSAFGDASVSAVDAGNRARIWYVTAVLLLFAKPLQASMMWLFIKDTSMEKYVSFVLTVLFYAAGIILALADPGLLLASFDERQAILIFYRLEILVAGIITLWLWLVFFLRRKEYRLRTGLMWYCLAMMISAFLIDFAYTEAPNFSQFLSMVLVVVHLNNVFRKLDRQMEDLKRSQHAELMASQIQPHFLFNALNAIYELCERDPRTAQSAIDSFSTFLRMNLRRIGNYMVDFSDELAHVDAYLNIEKIRFGERLNVVKNIQEENFMLPPLTLQPLVENAVRHGICKKEKGGTVYIYSRRTPDGVEVIVEDDGAGYDMSVPIDENVHVGVANVRHRLEYMAGGQLIMESKPDKGTKATIRLPLQL